MDGLSGLNNYEVIMRFVFRFDDPIAPRGTSNGDDASASRAWDGQTQTQTTRRTSPQLFIFSGGRTTCSFAPSLARSLARSLRDIGHWRIMVTTVTQSPHFKDFFAG